MDGANLYLYALGNPISFVDPLGLSAERFDWHSLLKNSSNFAAGFGDFVTLGGTYYLRELIGGNEVVDIFSGAYKAGGYSALSAELALGSLVTLQFGFTTTTIKTRAASSTDSAVVQYLKTKSNLTGRTIGVFQRVFKGGKIIHQHYKFKRFLPF